MGVIHSSLMFDLETRAGIGKEKQHDESASIALEKVV